MFLVEKKIHIGATYYLLIKIALLSSNNIESPHEKKSLGYGYMQTAVSDQSAHLYSLPLIDSVSTLK